MPPRAHATALATAPDGAVAMSVWPLGAGYLLVVDALGDRLVVLDARGRVRQQWLGMRGPEATVSTPIGALPQSDGTIWVQNAGHGRIAIFRMSSDTLAFQRLLRAGPKPVGFREGWAVAPGEQVVFLAQPQATWFASDPTPGVAALPMPDLVRVDRTGRELSRTRLAPPEGELVVFSHKTPVAGGERTSLLTQPFSPAPLSAVGPSGQMAVAFSASYRIRWHQSEDAAVTLEHPTATRVPLTGRERDSVEAIIASWARRQGLERHLVPFSAPTHKPLLRRLSFDRDGRLWVERDGPDGVLFDVYRPAQRAPERIASPAGVTLLPETAQGDTLFAVERKGATRWVLRVVTR